MVEIRKYPNRRLYDTDASRYVTLAEVAAMIAGGKELRVVDAKSGEDLTKVTMLQIICENKSQQEALPIAFLRQIIQAGDKVIRHSIGSYLAAGLQLPREIQRQVGNLARAAMLLNPFLAPFAARSSRHAGLYDPPTSPTEARLSVAERPAPYNAESPASSLPSSLPPSLSPASETFPRSLLPPSGEPEPSFETPLTPAEEAAFLREQLFLIHERLEELSRKA